MKNSYNIIAQRYILKIQRWVANLMALGPDLSAEIHLGTGVI